MFGRPPKKRRIRGKIVLNKDGKPTDLKVKMKGYIEKGPTRGTWVLFFCRGIAKCPRGPVAKQLAKHRCAECVLAEDNEAVGHLQERIKVLNEQ